MNNYRDRQIEIIIHSENKQIIFKGWGARSIKSKKTFMMIIDKVTTLVSNDFGGILIP